MGRSLLASCCILCSAAVVASDDKPPNPIDAIVFRQTPVRGVSPAAAASDEEFLRRLTQTTIGQLPTPDEVRAFVADPRPDKRGVKVDEMLGHDLHAAMWATRFSELTGNSVETIAGGNEERPRLSQLWHNWLRSRFAENTPYDVLVRRILTATSRDGLTLSAWVDREVEATRALRSSEPIHDDGRAKLDLFWRRKYVDDRFPTEDVAERIASAFMGVRINCARCHDHPFDRWTQEDYEAFVRVFGQVRYGMSQELRRDVAGRLQTRRKARSAGRPTGPALPRVTEVYLVGELDTDDTPAPLGGAPFGADRPDYRVDFVDWLTASENAFFARNLTNRVWAHYFGRGLVEPLDGHSSDREIPHAALLDVLSERFVTSGFDLRRLERMILNSRAWRLSSERQGRAPGTIGLVDLGRVRLPPPEVVIDMWCAATGIDVDFGVDAPHIRKAVELGPDRLAGNRWDALLRLFGRDDRTATCDCGHQGRPSIRQTLALMNDPELVDDVCDGVLAKLLAGNLANDDVIDELFLRTLSRWPTPAERAAARKACEAADRADAFEDTFWGLLNTQEFLVIH